MTGRGKVRHYFKYIFFLGINYSGSEDFLTSLTYSKKNTLLLKKRVSGLILSFLPCIQHKVNEKERERI